MKLTVDNHELSFNKMVSDIWSATVILAGYELDFEFSESVFFNKDAAEVTIDWDLIKYFAAHIAKNLEIIQTKGSMVLEELHRQIFGEDELYKTKGYFKMGGIKLENYKKHDLKDIDIAIIEHPDSPFVKYDFEYDIYYFLESEKELLMDPYHSYHAYFFCYRNLLTIRGVSRE